MSEFDYSFGVGERGVGVLWLKGSADIANHERVQHAFSLAQTSTHRGITVDIRALNFLTSLAIGELLALAKAKKQAGGLVAVAGPNEYIAGVFAKTNLGAVLPVKATVEEAITVCAGC